MGAYFLVLEGNFNYANFGTFLIFSLAISFAEPNFIVKWRNVSKKNIIGQIASFSKLVILFPK
ncbi:hypothetical protein CM15mP5_1900 [bacterium]|nr:MAG: hypothetical protein CM15mP5_1900 [bacterium]